MSTTFSRTIPLVCNFFVATSLRYFASLQVASEHGSRSLCTMQGHLCLPFTTPPTIVYL